MKFSFKGKWEGRGWQDIKYREGDGRSLKLAPRRRTGDIEAVP